MWYRDNAGLGEVKLGRFLGIASQITNIMTFSILAISGHVIACGSVSRMTELEKQQDTNRQRMEEFDRKIAEKYKEERLSVSGDKPDLQHWEELLEDDSDFADEFNRIYDNIDVKEADDEFTPDSYDHYLHMELAIDRGGDHPEHARVTKRLKDKDGRPIGTAHENPILDSRMYEVEFLDGHRQAMSANNITQNMFAQVDEHGH